MKATSNRDELVWWLGGAVAIGLVFGLVLGTLGDPAGGAAAGVAAAVVWLLLGAVRHFRRGRDQPR